ncbi:MAG: hypothetical protein HY735_19210 [Verrucomicrobia bacterium]|nr:hypothetical protein [Verrucomicrobiota bacterium]
MTVRVRSSQACHGRRQVAIEVEQSAQNATLTCGELVAGWSGSGHDVKILDLKNFSTAATE